MKLMVLNLPRKFSENDFSKLFTAYGNIKGCTIVIDASTGKSKGFGFIEMALTHEGATAIKELNGSTVGDKKIRVKEAK